jgi:hypothetical protein
VTELTIPSMGDLISFSIFMASRMSRTCPAATRSPGWTSTWRTLPAMGDFRSWRPEAPRDSFMASFFFFSSTISTSKWSPLITTWYRSSDPSTSTS